MGIFNIVPFSFICPIEWQIFTALYDPFILLTWWIYPLLNLAIIIQFFITFFLWPFGRYYGLEALLLGLYKILNLYYYAAVAPFFPIIVYEKYTGG